MPIRPYIILAVAFLSLALLSLAAPHRAEARLVQVFKEDAEADPPRILAKDEIRAKGFQEAVFQEAIDLLPAPLDDVRRTLLRDYLDPLAEAYVRSFAEAGDTGPDLALLDVTVDRSMLKKTLQEIGVYFTVEELRRYNLMLVGAMPEAWEQLGALQTLYGLQVEAGAMPSLSLEYTQDMGEPIWQGTLETEQAFFTGADKELAALWRQLWKQYFTRPEIGDAAAETVMLRVEGWFAPDGVEAFDRILRGWDDALQGATLETVTMRPAGIGAVWKVELVSRSALQWRLEEFLPPRNLSYGFQDGEAQ